MKTWVLGLLNLAIFSVTAMAAPQHSSLNKLVERPDQNCDEAARDGFADLVHRITNDPSPVLEDPRKSGADGARAAGMTVDEYKRAQETTGYVVCPGRRYKNGAMGSGALVGPGNQVLTSAHIFIDEDGQFREPLSECFIQTQANPPQRRLLNFSAQELFKLFTSLPKSDLERDLALIRIVETDQPITKFKPFPVRKSGKTLVEDKTTITMVSASHKDLAKNPKFPPTDPIFQTCKYKNKTFVAKGGRRIDGIHSDCIADGGGSGSIQMVRDEDGQLEIAGVTTVSGKTLKCQYSISNQCNTYATEITAGIVREIDEFQMANANTRSSTQDANNRGL